MEQQEVEEWLQDVADDSFMARLISKGDKVNLVLECSERKAI
jgi:hypothetical protein